MRIECNPEKAKYAMKDGVEFVADGYGNWKPRSVHAGWLTTATMQALGATFETDLPPVPDGKEYEYKLGKDCSGPKPKGVMVFNRYTSPTSWELSQEMDWAIQSIYAIPIKKESCVVEGVVLYNTPQSVALEKQAPGGMSVLVIPKDQATVKHLEPDINAEVWLQKEYLGFNKRITLIVVREDK